jgi:hypothetical protein
VACSSSVIPIKTPTFKFEFSSVYWHENSRKILNSGSPGDFYPIQDHTELRSGRLATRLVPFSPHSRLALLILPLPDGRTDLHSQGRLEDDE